jgi:hypothetical protein
VVDSIGSRLSLALKVGAGTHEGNALVHDPLADVEVLVDGILQVLGLDLLGLQAGSRSVSACKPFNTLVDGLRT